jgi:4-hydroxy-tetrahydrodipicolinate reductase
MTMKIAIIGYGRMGQEIEKAALQKGHEIVAKIDSFNPCATAKEITTESLNGADVAIDFTVPADAIKNAKAYADAGINTVMGTTGWYDHMKEMESIAKTGNIGMIWSGNFSIGVNLFFRMIEDACKRIDNVKEYDAFAYELHHRQKKDSPSGTAEMIGKIMLDNLSGKKKIVREKLDRKINDDEFHLASVRAGSIPGTHVVGFDSEFDTIELKHSARSRGGFALGAVLAAEWIKGKKGFFGIDEFIKSLFE